MSFSITQRRALTIPASAVKRRGTLATVGCVVATWRRRCRERAELARMTPRELKDARVLPHEAWSEIRKPFWRA